MTDKKKLIFVLIPLAVVVLAVFAFFYSRQIRQQQDPITATAFKLNTVVTITVYDSQDQGILDGALALCDEYERIFSRTLEESELYQLNAGTLPQENGAFLLSDSLADLISQGLYYSNLSGGAFDISIAPVSSLWDFTSGEAVLPDEQALSEALPLVDHSQIFLDGNSLRFGMEGMELDLGAIAKGYIADLATRTIQMALNAHGSYGVTKEYSVERFLRDAAIFPNIEGAADVQRLISGNYILRRSDSLL